MIWGRGDLPRNGLSAEERARGVDVECPSPFLGRHVHSVLAAHHASETAQNVCAAQLRGGFFDRLLDLGRIRDVDFLRYNLCIWEVRPQRFDFGIGV